MKKLFFIFVFSTLFFLVPQAPVNAACDPVACAAKGSPTYQCTGTGSNCEQYTWGCRGTPSTCTFGPHLPGQAQNLCCPGGGSCLNGACSTGTTCASQATNASCMPATVCSTTAGNNVGVLNCTTGNICCTPAGTAPPGSGGPPPGSPPGPNPSPPCFTGPNCNSDQGSFTPTCNGKDIACKTAIGDITTSPQGFVTKIFAVLLSLVGGIAIILIIISGYKLMTSGGNPERVQGAKEQLTAAIVGLLFVIFSFVILQLIGVNLLGLPGFTP